MTFVFRILLCFGVIFFLALIVALMRRRRLSLRYSLVWGLMAVAMLVCAVFPGLMDALSALLGIQSTVNTVFLLTGFVSLLIILSLSSIVSNQAERIRDMAQACALAEKRIRDLEAALGKDGGGHD